VRHSSGHPAMVGAASTDRIFVLAGTNWHKGVLGLTAGRIAQRYHRPTLAIGIEGELAVGSAMDPWPFGTSRLPRSARDRDPGQIDCEDTARARHVAHSNFASVHLDAGSADGDVFDIDEDAIGGCMWSEPHASMLSIDAAGLRIESNTAEAARELNSIAGAGMAQQARGSDRGSSGPYTRSLERNEDLLRFDPRSGLGSLSDQTGGFLIHDTNDLVSGLRRIDDDMNGYYFLTYVPKNKDYDGRFRRISVKVARSNIEVQSRQGYYAVESAGELPMLDYEAPAIAAARNWNSGSKQSPLRSPRPRRLRRTARYGA